MSSKRNNWVTIIHHHGKEFEALVKFPNGKEETVKVETDEKVAGTLLNIVYNLNGVIVLIPLDEVDIVEINPRYKSKTIPFNYENRFR